MEISKELLGEIKTYIEGAEVMRDCEFGNNRELDEIVSDGDMPELFTKVTALLAVNEFKSEYDRSDEYYQEMQMPTVGDYRDLLKLKDRSTALYDKRYQAAIAVIDLIAERIGLQDKGHYLYAPLNGSSPLVEKLDDYLDRSGDKVKMKRRIDELETENAVLRSLVGK